MARPSYNIIDLPLSFPHNFRHYNYFCKKALFPSIYSISALLCTSFPARILRRYLIIQNWSVSKSTWFNIDLDEVLMNLTRPKVHPRMSHPTNSSPIPPFAHRSTDYYWLLSPPFGAGPKFLRSLSCCPHSNDLICEDFRNLQYQTLPPTFFKKFMHSI